jgi:hypothetical protein
MHAQQRAEGPRWWIGHNWLHQQDSTQGLMLVKNTCFAVYAARGCIWNQPADCTCHHALHGYA